MEKFQPKKLWLTESDFENLGKRKDYHYGYEYNVFKIEKRKLVPAGEESELINENMTAEDWAKIATITCGDSRPRPTETHFIFDTSHEIGELLELMEHNYISHQFIKQFGCVLRYDHLMELYNEYTDMFDDVFKQYGIRVQTSYNEEKQRAAADELGLERVAYGGIWCQSNLCDKKKIYIGDVSYVNFLPNDYGGCPVYIEIDRSDMCSLHANTNARVPNTRFNRVDGKAENIFKHDFSMQEPQRWKMGKLTDKKRIAWMEYIEAYFNGLYEFCGNRNNAVEESMQRLLNAGFVKIDSCNFTKTAEDGLFKCTAEVCDDGKIYKKLEITDYSRIYDKYFKY